MTVTTQPIFHHLHFYSAPPLLLLTLFYLIPPIIFVANSASSHDQVFS